MRKPIVSNKELSFVVAPEVSQLDVIRKLADKHHWVPPQVIREGGMIEAPVIEGLWRYEPLIDKSIIPSSARKRVELILKSIPVQGFIIGHEIEIETKPKVKPLPWIVAPEPETKPEVKPLPWIVAPEPKTSPKVKPLPWRLPKPKKPDWEIDWEKVEDITWKAGDITWKVAKVLGIALAGTALILLACMGAAVGCATDPTVIVVTEDGLWVEIYCFYS